MLTPAIVKKFFHDTTCRDATWCALAKPSSDFVIVMDGELCKPASPIPTGAEEDTGAEFLAYGKALVNFPPDAMANCTEFRFWSVKVRNNASLVTSDKVNVATQFELLEYAKLTGAEHALLKTILSSSADSPLTDCSRVRRVSWPGIKLSNVFPVEDWYTHPEGLVIAPTLRHEDSYPGVCRPLKVKPMYTNVPVILMAEHTSDVGTTYRVYIVYNGDFVAASTGSIQLPLGTLLKLDTGSVYLHNCTIKGYIRNPVHIQSVGRVSDGYEHLRLRLHIKGGEVDDLEKNSFNLTAYEILKKYNLVRPYGSMYELPIPEQQRGGAAKRLKTSEASFLDRPLVY